MTQINTGFCIAVGIGNLILALRAGYEWVIRNPKKIAWYESLILGIVMIGSGAVGLTLLAQTTGIIPL